MSNLDGPLPSLSGSMSGDTPAVDGGFQTAGELALPQLLQSFLAPPPPQSGPSGMPQVPGSVDTRNYPPLTSQPSSYDTAKAFMR